jgi:hypothetical protein
MVTGSIAAWPDLRNGFVATLGSRRQLAEHRWEHRALKTLP